jgi:hypothetical protein
MSSKILELQRASQDVVKIHNPTNDDYVVEWDRFETNTPWVIPNQQSDRFGCGAGNREVPRYIAYKFLHEITDQMITEMASKEWKKLRKNYGATEQTAKEEERIMTNFLRDDKKRDDIAKLVWLGVTRRHGDLLPSRPQHEVIDRTKSDEELAIERLGLDEEIVEEFANDISE